jgi:hypothetical protein
MAEYATPITGPPPSVAPTGGAGFLTRDDRLNERCSSSQARFDRAFPPTDTVPPALTPKRGS